MHLKFHYGNLKNQEDIETQPNLPEDEGQQSEFDSNQPRNPTYLEFRRNRDSSKVYGDCDTLVSAISEILKNPIKHQRELYGSIFGLSFNMPFRETWRARLLINSEVEIPDEREFHKYVLDEISNYLALYLARARVTKR